MHTSHLRLYSCSSHSEELRHEQPASDILLVPRSPRQAAAILLPMRADATKARSYQGPSLRIIALKAARPQGCSGLLKLGTSWYVSGRAFCAYIV